MKIREITVHGNKRFQVDFGRTNGSRHRPVFRSKDAAIKAIQESEKNEKRYGELWLQMSVDERYQLMGVFSECRRSGVSIRHVWDVYRKNNSNSNGIIASVPYEDAVQEWEKRKLRSGKDPRYVKEGAQLLLRFPKKDERRNPISE